MPRKHARLSVVGMVAGALAFAPSRPADAQGLTYGWGFNAGGGYNDCAANGVPNSLCGQTGVPNVTLVPAPAALTAIGDAVAIGAGMFHSLAIRADGTVWAWGMNGSGQLGSGGGAGAYSITPVQVPSIDDAVAVAGGWHQSHAIRRDGTLWSWGSAYTGLGSYSSFAPPTQVPGLSGVVGVAAGEVSGHAVLSDGTLWSWGFNGTGQLGTGSFASFAFAPVRVTTLQNVVAVATHFVHVLALTTDGAVWAFGGNSNGQLGDGTRVDRRSPVQVTGLNNVVQIAAGAFNSYALRSDGTVWTWGNHGGFDYLSPVPIGFPVSVNAIAAGGRHLIARTEDGSLLGWGWNDSGQLGVGAPGGFFWSPTPVVGLGAVGLFTAGRAHTLAVLADLTPPALTLPGDVYTDGTSPAGAVVEYAVSATDNADPSPVVVCTPSSGSLFPLLVTEVTCTATDRAGNAANGAFNVIVKDAYWQLQDLTGLVTDSSLGRLGSSLLDKLEAARRFIVAGKSSQACESLASFIRQVNTQREKALTNDQADDFSGRAARIQSVCGC